MHGKRWRRENFLEVATALHAKEFGPSSLWVPKSENCLPTSRSIVSPHPGCF
jgi:hypothetical protein